MLQLSKQNFFQQVINKNSRTMFKIYSKTMAFLRGSIVHVTYSEYIQAINLKFLLLPLNMDMSAG